MLLVHALCLQHAAVCLLVMPLVALQLPAQACSNVSMLAPHVPAMTAQCSSCTHASSVCCVRMPAPNLSTDPS